ncbi:MAG: ribosome small subunit-dependent GTPase A, partial [Fibrobacterota bacterium]
FNASRLSVPVSLIFNKKDLLTEEDRNELAFYKESYSRIVSVVHAVTTKSPEETRRILTEICRGRCSVFAGPSGTGKSSLMKILFPDIPFRTSQLSRHISRGRNTTTHTSLLSLNRDSFIADTPGFSHTPLELVNPADVSRHFPDIAAHAGECAFRNCIHESEPRCAVKAAVETEDIEPERYYNYLDILDEVRNRSTYGKPSFRRR